MLVKLTEYLRIHALRFLKEAVKYNALIERVFCQDPIILSESRFDLCTDGILVLRSGSQVIDPVKSLSVLSKGAAEVWNLHTH